MVRTVISFLGLTICLTLTGLSYGVDEEPDTGPFFMLEPPSNVLIRSHIGEMIACSAHGKPVPVMDWEKADGTALLKDPKYIKIHANNSLQFLPFTGLLKSSIHRTAYRCVAKNSVGKVVSRSVHVKTVKTDDYREYDVYTQNVWVMKGNTAVFTCDVRPSFVRSYVKVNSWYIGDQQVVSDGENIINLGSTLHLTRVGEQDNLKMIKCVTENHMLPSLRKASQGGVLHVIKPVETAPSMEYYRERMTTKSGTNVTLPCVAYAYPIASYNWSKNGTAVHQSARIRVTRGELRLSNVVSGDSGMYWCNASNIHGFRIISTYLLVTEPLSVRMKPRTQKIDALRPAELLCAISGGPYNQVTWYRNGSPLLFTDNIKRIGDAALRVLSVSRRDVGMYQCLVSAQHENMQASSQLLLGVSAPTFHDSMGAMFKHPRQTVSLKCKVYGNPPPTVLWKLADAVLLPTTANSSRVQVRQYMTAEGDIVSHVNISSLRVTDGGKYICVANNSIGKAEQVAQLNVYGPPVVRSMSNRTAVANRTLRLECHVSGYPIARISWSKDGSSLRMDHRISSTDDGVLIINSVVVADRGFYNCSASNGDMQMSSARVYVSVISEPLLELEAFPSLVQGNKYTATCQVRDGDQPIELSWYRNDELITPYSLRWVAVKITSPLTTTLSFSSIETAHVGNYTCVARNKAGVVNITAELATVKVKPYFLVRPNDDSVVVGSNKQLPCKGAGVPQPVIVWKKAVDYNAGQYRTITDADISNYEVLTNGSLLIRNASQEDKGYYMCQVDNDVGGSGVSKTVLLSVNVPATYLERTSTREFLVGDNVSLVCDAVGDQPLSTAWSRRKSGSTQWLQLNGEGNSRVLIARSRTAVGVESVLKLGPASRQDSGEYLCTCKNQFGHSTRSINVRVTERPHAVDQLTVIGSVSRRITLSWRLTDNGNSPITQYIVQYTPLRLTAGKSWKRVTSRRSPATVVYLNPATRYKFRVIAVNKVGPSKPSPEVVAMTAEERPTGPPRNVELSTLSPSTISITWLAPQSKLQHGRMQGYKIGYKLVNSTNGYAFLWLRSSNELSHTLLNLETNTSYMVTVASYNRKGLGPSSDPVIAVTFEDVPSRAPADVKVTASSQSVHVEWEAPKLPYMYGKISGYKVIIHSVNSRQDETDEQVHSTKATRVSLTKLKVYADYSVQVLAYTPSGDGVRSQRVFARTSPAPPSEPLQVSASPVNSSSVLVSWLPPAPPSGMIQQYQLTVYSSSKPLRNVTVTHPNIRQQILVTGLVRGQLYAFVVKAKNFQTNYGKPSDKVTATPSIKATPSFAALDRSIEVGYHKSVLLPCPVVGNPQPSVVWSKGEGKPIPEHFKVLGNGTVFVESILKEDTGSYTCSASNTHGETSLTVSLQVLDLPSAPKLKVSKVMCSSIQISWLSTGNGGFPISGWSLEVRNNSVWRDVPIISSDERSHWLRHLACGQLYDMRMRTLNQEGSSPYSSILSVSTLGGKPIAPTKEQLVRMVNKTSISLDLRAWSDNGCPITFFSITYKVVARDRSVLLSSVSSSQGSVDLNDLISASWYIVDVTAHSTAGSTSTSLHVSTLTTDGFTIAPLHQVESVEGRTEDTTTIAILVPLSVVVLALLITVAGCFFVMKRRRRKGLQYKGGDKSRHSMFSDVSDLDPHHPARTQFVMPRENLSGDSRVWLLHPPPTNCDPEPPSPTDKSEGDYETCTPTLTYARAKMSKESHARCVHGAMREYCHYCGDLCAEDKLLDVEDTDQFNKAQLKQFEIPLDHCDEEFPPPPPEALHEYHCEPIGKRCTSHEFMRHNGNSIASRPNTTGLQNGVRTDTPGRMRQYPSCLSSMATVSSNQEELLMAYHNSKINPPGPILFESPRRHSTSASPESSIATEPGIRMFTQSPPKPEESRQAVCEVPIYSTTLPLGCSFDHSSDTTDQEPRSKSSRLKSPHRKPYKRKIKRVRHQRKYRGGSDEMSTNSDDNSAYGVPHSSSSMSSTSDKGYGTKNKDTDDSCRASSHRKSRECGNLYEEEEETASLMQTALGAGETTPPSSLRNLNKNLDEMEKPTSDDSKLIDRYYRTVSSEHAGSMPVELYTEDYTIV